MSNLLIIGSEGKMGKWFFKYFHNYHKISKNSKKILIDKIYLFDIKKSSYKKFKDQNFVIISNNLLDSIKISDIIIFCTPVNETKKLINEHKFNFKSKSTIIEISSIKEPIFDDLVTIAKLIDIDIFCIHPMFGPGASLYGKNNIIFVPIDQNQISTLLSNLNTFFPLCKKILINTPEKHDFAISITISLIYFINLAFSKLLIDIDKNNEFIVNGINTLPFLKEISGSSFKVQTTLSESILTDEISLFLSLFFSSRQTISIFEKYEKILSNIINIISVGDTDSLKNIILNIQKDIKNHVDLDQSYLKLYKFLNF